jgi:hypothetical protein
VVAAIRGVNVMLDWQRAFAEQWPILFQVISAQPEIRNLFIAWYLLPSDQEAWWSSPNARPITVGEARDKLNSAQWHAHRTPTVMGYSTDFNSAKNPPTRFTLPAYGLPGQQILLLDGAHRAVALAISDVQFAVTLAVIHGPIEEAALLDLRHWQ